MRHALIIAAREIVDKKLLFLGAALCAIIVLMTPLLPGARSENAVQVMTAGALALAFAFVAATTIFLGIGIISRDLGEGRMTFYLARPVRIWSIWLGKTVAVLLIALGCGFVLVLIPTLFGGGLFSLGGFLTDLHSYSLAFGLVLRTPELSIPLLLMLLTVFALHLGLAVRSRTPWLGLDFAVMAGAAGILWISLRPFLLQYTYGGSTLVNLASIGALTLTAAVAAGNLLGFHRGRSDLQVTHKWTSLATSLLVVLGIGSFTSYAYKVRSFGIEKMRWANLLAADDDSGWIAIEGGRVPEWNAYRANYFLNLDTGESISLPGGLQAIRFAQQSALFWERTQLDPLRVKLVRIDLSSGGREDLDYEAYENFLGAFAVDPSGTTAAWTVNEQLQVIDTTTGNSIFSARLPGPDPWYGWALSHFQDPKTLLVYVGGEERTIHRVDLDEKRIETTGSLPGGWFYFSGENVCVHPEGTRAPAELRRADSGQLVTTLEPRTRVLPDGQRVVPDSEVPTRLLIQSPAGETETVVGLPRPGTLGRVNQVRDDALLISQYAPRGDFKGLTTWFVNLGTNEVTEVGRGLQPEIVWPSVYAKGSVGSRILQDGNGALFLFDPETLELKHLAGGDR